MQVKEFAAAGQTFSVHDITRTVREKVNNALLEIPEVEASGASFRFDIPHAKVKALFEELWRTGIFNPDFTLTRKFNSQYFEYTPVPTTAATVTPSVPSYTVSPSTTPATTTATAAPSTSVSNDGSVESRVQQYLTNCASRNFRPTLKQVQSAIKRGDVSTGWSCDSLKTVIEGFGYTVVADPDSVSASQVVL
jgi:hypothetical protein